MVALDSIQHISIGRPITRGPLRACPLYLHGPAAPAYRPGPLAGGDVTVDEKGSQEVPTLTVTNRGQVPVLLIDGETFEGGLQNRMLNVSALLAAGSTDVPVSCVEAGRWGGRRAMSASPRMAPTGVRRVKTAALAANVYAGRGKVGDQGGVWQEVDRTLSRRGVKSESSALHDMYAESSGGDAVHQAATELGQMGPLPGQNGVAIVCGSRVVAVEIFDRPETLAAYWPRLMEAHALDEPTQGDFPSLGTVLRFVRRSARLPGKEERAVGLGSELHFGNDSVAGAALIWEEAVVHLSMLAIAA